MGRAISSGRQAHLSKVGTRSLLERWLWVLLIQRPPPPSANSNAHSQSDSLGRHLAKTPPLCSTPSKTLNGWILDRGQQPFREDLIFAEVAFGKIATFKQAFWLFDLQNNKTQCCRSVAVFHLTGYSLEEPFRKGIWLPPPNSLLTIRPSKILPIKIPNKRSSSLPDSNIEDAMRRSYHRDRETFPRKIGECFVARNLFTVWCIWECWECRRADKY